MAKDEVVLLLALGCLLGLLFVDVELFREGGVLAF